MAKLALLTAVVLSFLSVATAQEAKWLVGKWHGETLGRTGLVDRREVVFGPDGSFTSDVQSARAGLMTHAGRCVVTGETAKCTATVKTGPGDVRGTSVEYELALKGDNLEGTIASGNPYTTRPVILKRVK